MTHLRIRIFHEYGAPRHFSALFYLKEKYKPEIEIQQIVFDPTTLIYKSLINFNLDYFVKNCTALLQTLLSNGRPSVINVVGIAPLHYFVYYFEALVRQGKPVVYFTSWPYWNFNNREYKNWPHQYPLVNLSEKWLDFIRHVDAVVCVTKASCKALRKYSRKCFWIPHSVDTKLFRPRDERKKTNRVIVLFVGRLTEEKGVPELVDIAKNRIHKGNIEFWFVGRGPFEGYLNRLMKSLPTIKYLGYTCSDTILANIYRMADILVLPSKRKRGWEELFGIVLIEAMSSGLPVIASNHIGPREIITDGFDGLLIKSSPIFEREEFIKELLDYILWLADNPDFRIEMGKRGREKVKQLYDIRINSKKWAAVLRYIVANS